MQARSRSYYESNFLSKYWRSKLAEMVRSLMPEGWQEMRLLDVGVGDGYTIRLIKPEGEIHGIDIEGSALEQAESRGINVKLGSTHGIPYPDNSLDIVTCIEMLEHLEHPTLALKEIR